MSYPEANPELLKIVYSIYQKYGTEQFGLAVWQYRREQNLIVERAAKKQALEELAKEIEE